MLTEMRVPRPAATLAADGRSLPFLGRALILVVAAMIAAVRAVTGVRGGATPSTNRSKWTNNKWKPGVRTKGGIDGIGCSFQRIDSVEDIATYQRKSMRQIVRTRPDDVWAYHPNISGQQWR